MDDVFAAAAEVSVHEAMDSKKKHEWDRAIQSEVESLIKNDTLDIVTRNVGQNVVGSQSVLSNKYGPDEYIQRRKARIMAKSYSQKYGVDYYQAFAPVARLETIRLLMAIAVQYGLRVHQVDVVTAYLNAPLEETVIMDVSERMEEALEKIASVDAGESTIGPRAAEMLSSLRAGGNACKLNRALYGLRQSGRQWHTRLDEKLKSLHLSPTRGDPCLYVSHRGTEILLLVIYVDDILIAARDLEWIAEIKRGLKEEFDIKDLGLAQFCLGLEIHQEEDEITLTQSGYILDMLRRFGMENCNPVTTPAELRASQKREAETTSTDHWPYRELIGALLYLATTTQPDIANTVSRLTQGKRLVGGKASPTIPVRCNLDGVEVHADRPTRLRIFRRRLGQRPHGPEIIQWIRVHRERRSNNLEATEATLCRSIIDRGRVREPIGGSQRSDAPAQPPHRSQTGRIG